MVSALSVIRLPLFGTDFQLKSANLLLLRASKQTSNPTSLRNRSTVPTDPSSRHVQCVCVCVCVYVCVCMCVCVCMRACVRSCLLFFNRSFIMLCDVSYFSCFVFVLFIVIFLSQCNAREIRDAFPGESEQP